MVPKFTFIHWKNIKPWYKFLSPRTLFSRSKTKVETKAEEQVLVWFKENPLLRVFFKCHMDKIPLSILFHTFEKEDRTVT